MDHTDSDASKIAIEKYYNDLQDLVIWQASRLINDSLYTESLLSTLPVALISTDKDGLVQVANKAAEEMLQTELKSIKGLSLLDLFALSKDITGKIKEALEQEAPVSADSQELLMSEDQKKVVNIHVRPFYDEERKMFGTLLALEDQTYLSFLRESLRKQVQFPSDDEIVANSPKMKLTVKQLKEAAKTDGPVLFSGPSGSGKTFLSAKLHKSIDPDLKTPLIFLDCYEIDDSGFKETLLGSGENQREEEQFLRFKSLHDYGTVHLAEGGTLVLLNIDALEHDDLEALNIYIEQVKDDPSSLPKCRIMATTKVDPAEFAKREEFPESLLNELLLNHITVPALRDRRKDILPLAREFMANQENEDEITITKGAENGLLSKKYNQNNVKELKDAIDLAVLVAGDNSIQSEHIFTGPMEQATDHELDLTDFAPVKFLIKDKTLAWLRGGVLAFFAVIISITLFFPANVAGTFANNLVWGGWWVFLVIGFLLIGRVWCTICPLSTAGRLAQRVLSLTKSPSGFIKKASPFLIPLGFVGILWVEHFFHMTTNPRPTGFLLIALISLAVIFALIFERETWCRYLCPLGNFGGIFALSATLFVRSNPNVCSTKCTTHNCNKGSEEYPGCPVFHHPLYARNSHICKLCFTCLKSCPHGSARLYLRPPLVRIWQQLDIEETIGFFALVLFFLAPWMLASERIPIVLSGTAVSLAIIASFIFAVICRRTLPTLLFGDDENKLLGTSRIILVLLLLAWGPFAAFQYDHVFGLDTLFITSGEQNQLYHILPEKGIPLLSIIQLSAVWFATLLGVITLFGIGSRAEQGWSGIAVRNSYLVYGACLLYPLFASWIILY